MMCRFSVIYNMAFVWFHEDFKMVKSTVYNLQDADELQDLVISLSYFKYLTILSTCHWIIKRK